MLRAHTQDTHLWGSRSGCRCRILCSRSRDLGRHVLVLSRRSGGLFGLFGLFLLLGRRVLATAAAQRTRQALSDGLPRILWLARRIRRLVCLVVALLGAGLVLVLLVLLVLVLVVLVTGTSAVDAVGALLVIAGTKAVRGAGRRRRRLGRVLLVGREVVIVVVVGRPDDVVVVVVQVRVICARRPGKVCSWTASFTSGQLPCYAGRAGRGKRMGRRLVRTFGRPLRQEADQVVIHVRRRADDEGQRPRGIWVLQTTVKKCT